jgi:hypothetical protein
MSVYILDAAVPMFTAPFLPLRSRRLSPSAYNRMNHRLHIMCSRGRLARQVTVALILTG